MEEVVPSMVFVKVTDCTEIDTRLVVDWSWAWEWRVTEKQA